MTFLNRKLISIAITIAVVKILRVKWQNGRGGSNVIPSQELSLINMSVNVSIAASFLLRLFHLATLAMALFEISPYLRFILRTEETETIC